MLGRKLSSRVVQETESVEDLGSTRVIHQGFAEDKCLRKKLKWKKLAKQTAGKYYWP